MVDVADSISIAGLAIGRRVCGSNIDRKPVDSNGPSCDRLHWISVTGSANEKFADQPALLCMNATIGGCGAPAGPRETLGVDEADAGSSDPSWAAASGTARIIASAATPRRVFVSMMRRSRLEITRG